MKNDKFHCPRLKKTSNFGRDKNTFRNKLGFKKWQKYRTKYYERECFCGNTYFEKNFKVR